MSTCVDTFITIIYNQLFAFSVNYVQKYCYWRLLFVWTDCFAGKRKLFIEEGSNNNKCKVSARVNGVHPGVTLPTINIGGNSWPVCVQPRALPYTQTCFYGET